MTVLELSQCSCDLQVIGKQSEIAEDALVRCWIVLFSTQAINQCDRVAVTHTSPVSTLGFDETMEKQRSTGLQKQLANRYVEVHWTWKDEGCGVTECLHQHIISGPIDQAQFYMIRWDINDGFILLMPYTYKGWQQSLSHSLASGYVFIVMPTKHHPAFLSAGAKWYIFKKTSPLQSHNTTALVSIPMQLFPAHFVPLSL